MRLQCLWGVVVQLSLVPACGRSDLRISSDDVGPPPDKLDTTFGDHGLVLVPVKDNNGTLLPAALNDVTVLADGQIVACGYTIVNDNDILLVMLNDNGSLTDSFGNQGIVVDDVGSSNEAYGILADGDTFMVTGRTAAWGAGSEVLVGRFGADGRLANGQAYMQAVNLTNEQDSGRALVRTGVDRFVVTGRVGDPNSDFLALAVNGEGVIDTGFAAQGWGRWDFGTNREEAVGITVFPDGRLRMVGTNDSGTTSDVSVLALTSAGALDTSFAGGRVQWRGNQEPNNGRSVLIDNLGNTVVVGSTTTGGNRDIVALRYLPTGELDPSFGEAGVARVDVDGGDDNGVDAWLIGTTQLLILATSTRGDEHWLVLARLNGSGLLDPFFAGTGVAQWSFGSTAVTPQSFVLDQQGRVVVVGYINTGADMRAFSMRFTHR